MAQHRTIEPPQSPAPPPHGALASAPRTGEGPAAGGERAVAFDQVVKRFGKEEVLHGLSFRVPWGEILGVIGPSGSGKTTTIRMMLGMYKPSSGTVRLFGRDPWKLRRSDRERIGYMPQDFVLYPALTTEENLRFAASLYGCRGGKRSGASSSCSSLSISRTRARGGRRTSPAACGGASRSRPP